MEVEEELQEAEKKRKDILFEKISLINRLKIIINSLVQDDLEKEIILSFFFDLNTTLEGLSYEDILKKLFIQKKKRAGVTDFEEYRVEPEDSKYINRGKKLLAIIQMFIRNFDFIRQDINNQIYFEF
mgnify:CR=1 FL=1